MAERNVMAAFMRALSRDLSGAWCRKIHGGPYMAGLPDYVVAWGERTCWVETKDDGKKLSPTQRAEFSRMTRAGAIVFVGDDGAALAAAAIAYLRGSDRYPSMDAPLRWPLHEVRKKEPGRRLAEG